MRIFFTVLALMSSTAVMASEPYRVTPYFECIVGKGITEKVWHDLGTDEAMDAALLACASADPGAPPADQDVVDNREYMRTVAYELIAQARADVGPMDIGVGN